MGGDGLSLLMGVDDRLGKAKLGRHAGALGVLQGHDGTPGAQCPPGEQASRTGLVPLATIRANAARRCLRLSRRCGR
jgi:hypothetical protein